MKKLGKRLLTYVLVLAMLMSLYTPAYGAQVSGEDTAAYDAQISGETDSTVSDPQMSQENDTPASDTQTTKETDTSADDIQTSGETDTEAAEDAAPSSDGEASEQEENQTGALPLNYILTQEDDEHQSVIVELGDTETTLLENAVLTYQDGEGEIHTAQAEEVVENVAAFLLELPAAGQERTFVSVKVSVAGQEYETLLRQQEEMEQVAMSSEEAAQAVAEIKNEEAGLDSQTAEQVKSAVLSADENGISAEAIKESLTENNQLAENTANGIQAFALGEEADAPTTFAVEPKKKDDYIVVLDPGHGTIDTNGYDSGAVHTFSDGTKFVEADITMKIANYLKQELAKYPQITVYMTHDTVGANKAIKMTLNERVAFAANKHADLLVSLHLNSFDKETAHGAEVLVPKTGRYNTEVAENAQKAANNILKRLTSLGLYDRGLVEKNSGDYHYPDGSTADYYAIIREGLKASIPSIIVEHAFLSGKDDKKYLNSEAAIKNLAKADAYGIAQYFGIETGGETYEPVPEPKGEWKKSGNSWYYYIGTVKQTGWQKIDNSWYYFNAKGVMLTGWQLIGNCWYYMNSSGVMQTGWQKIGGSWYYLNTSGSMQTGWQKIGGKLYYLQGNGAMLEGGWHMLGSYWYYMSGNGAALTGWQNLGGRWYYMDKNARMKTGWYKVDKKWYYSDGSGAMQTGWLYCYNTWYYLNGNGAMAEGWISIGGTWYYMQPGNGAMKTGWQKIDGKWYFLNPNGAMRTGGWFNQGYVWYYLNGNGSMAEGWIRLGNTWYYMQPNSGHMRTGWYQVGKKWYYSDGSGAMQTGWLKPGNTWYYLTGNGAMAEGWTFINGSWYYLTPGNGAMKTGWFQVNKVWYYCNGSGAMQTGWLQLGNIWYYLNSSGAMLTGWHTLGGKEYYFNNSGAWVPDKKKDNTQNLYAIEGKSSVTVDQMVKYYKKSGCTYPSAALKKGCLLYTSPSPRDRG